MSGQRCAVCRGEPHPSNVQCSCRRCANCGIISSTALCRRCLGLHECVACHRRLPPHCFAPNTARCQACCKRQDRPQSRSSANNVVNEVAIPTTASSESFDAFIDHNATLIDGIVDDYQHRHGYVTFLMHLINFSNFAYYFNTRFITLSKLTKLCLGVCV